jgi:Fe-S-cluster-containing dehydrogenase component
MPPTLAGGWTIARRPKGILAIRLWPTRPGLSSGGGIDMKQIRLNIAKCTGCGQCALTCAYKNVQKFDLEQSDIHILQWEDICLSVPQLCQQCMDAPCIAACPTDAIAFHSVTGAIVIDKDLCTQCYECRDDCRYQVIHIDYDGFPRTCDLCVGDPQCVKVCYPGSLTYEDLPKTEQEPLFKFAEVLVNKASGKNVPAPEELSSRSVT